MFKSQRISPQENIGATLSVEKSKQSSLPNISQLNSYAKFFSQLDPQMGHSFLNKNPSMHVYQRSYMFFETIIKEIFYIFRCKIVKGPIEKYLIC